MENREERESENEKYGKAHFLLKANIHSFIQFLLLSPVRGRGRLEPIPGLWA